MHRGIAATQAAEDVAAMSGTPPPKEAPAKARAEPETREQTIERKRAAARVAAADRKAWLENNVAASGRLKGRPSLYVRPWWELSEHEARSFDLSHGISAMVDQLSNKVHPVDRQLVFNALGATVAFYKLSRLIESLENEEWMDEVRSDLEHVRVGFDFAMQALDTALGDRGIALDARSAGGKNKSEPEWWGECAERAKQMLATGTDPRDLVGILQKRFKYSAKAIRNALKEKEVK